MYADDILLLSSSCIELQKMLDTCANIGSNLGIKFNEKKSMCLIIGPNKDKFVKQMCLNNNCLIWSEKIKYLGIFVDSFNHFNPRSTSMGYFGPPDALLRHNFLNLGTMTMPLHDNNPQCMC